MPRRRTAAGQLTGLVAESPRPIYVLDEQRTIVFCNAACAAWVGMDADELIGATCHYHCGAHETGPAAVAARLCPPPEAFADASSGGRVSALGPDGRSKVREAQFVPLGDRDSGGGVLVILAPQDLDKPDTFAADVEHTASELHLELVRLRREFADRYGIERMLGPSATAARVRAQVQLASAAPANVLIVGPAGSGKQHVAKAIHYRQTALPQPGDASQGLMPIACATLDPELLVSTVEALVTKATAARPLAGAEHRPATAALVLRDVDQVSLDVQPQLVRLFKAAPALRVISTARRTLGELVSQSQFSAELAMLLSTLTIELVPLASRIDDLPLLAQMFLEELNAAGGRQLSGFTPEALDQLTGYHWPGNLDELAQTVREAHREAAGFEITPRDLPKRIHLAGEAVRWTRKSAQPIDLEQVLQRVETELINRALAQAKGNKSRAAELLGLTRPRLYRRLVQLGLNGETEEIEFEELE